MLDLYMETTLINTHAGSAEKGTTLLAFPLFYFLPYGNNIILHLKA